MSIGALFFDRALDGAFLGGCAAVLIYLPEIRARRHPRNRKYKETIDLPIPYFRAFSRVLLRVRAGRRLSLESAVYQKS